mgnify:CR=1 FL=1
MWVLLLSGAACSCARDGASRTLLLVSVEVSEARSSMSTIDVDTVHSDERTISLAVIFVFIIYVRFIGIFYYPETPSDLLGSAELAELDPDGSRPLEGMHGLCGRRFDCFDPVCSAAVGVGAGILPSAGIEFLPREDALISQGHPSP